MSDEFLEQFASELGLQIPWRDSEHYEEWCAIVENAFYRMLEDMSDHAKSILEDAAKLTRRGP